MSMKIDCNFKEIHFELNVEDRVCVLYMNSGEGKTFLFKELKKAINAAWAPKYHYYDYTDYGRMNWNSNVLYEKGNIVIFDNPDLCQERILSVIKKSEACIVVPTKSLAWLCEIRDKALYHVEHDTNNVVMRKNV